MFERAADRDSGIVDKQVHAVMFGGNDLRKLSYCNAIRHVEAVSRHANVVCSRKICRPCHSTFIDVGKSEMTAATRE